MTADERTASATARAMESYLKPRARNLTTADLKRYAKQIWRDAGMPQRRQPLVLSLEAYNRRVADGRLDADIEHADRRGFSVGVTRDGATITRTYLVVLDGCLTTLVHELAHAINNEEGHDGCGHGRAFEQAERRLYTAMGLGKQHGFHAGIARNDERPESTIDRRMRG